VSLHVPGATEFPLPYLSDALDVDGAAAGLALQAEEWLRTELRRQVELGPTSRAAVEIRFHRRDALIGSEAARKVPRRTAG
jgi:hypothetical protein